jgi:hypothetical protein
VLSSAAVLEADSRIAQLSKVRRETIPANRSVFLHVHFSSGVSISTSSLQAA